MIAFCTITTFSYCPYALQLASNIKTLHPEADFFHLIIDATDEECLAISKEHNYKALPISFVEDDEIESMKIYFDAFEFCNSLKPLFFKFLFLKTSIEKLIYLDADIYVLNKFDSALEILNTKQFLLTPHTFNPTPHNLSTYSDFMCVQFGLYNGGFYGMSRSASTIKILDWLFDNLKLHGFVNWSTGEFVDQKFLTLIPHFFSQNTHIISHLGYNIAYWNNEERKQISNNDIVFFHFSGYKPSQPNKVCSYISLESNQHILSNDIFNKIFVDYKTKLEFYTKDKTYHTSYRHAKLNNKRLTKSLRKYYFINRSFSHYYTKKIFSPFYKLYKKIKFKIIPN